MNEAEFYQFADEYYAMHTDSIAASGEGPEYFAEYKIVDSVTEVPALAHRPTDPLDILAFGAGIGGSISYVNKHFPNSCLTCLDPSQRSLSVAEKHFPALAQYSHFDGTTIPFEADSFDIASRYACFITSTTTSILPSSRNCVEKRFARTAACSSLNTTRTTR